MKYLNLIRLPNILMIIAMQCIIKYGFFLPFQVEITLSTLGFIFLVIATTSIAAGGYVINDILDITTDKINKPKKRVIAVSITEKKAKSLYYLLTFGGLGFGFILSAMIMKPHYFLFFAITALSLYLYSRFLKKIALLGNMVVSLAVGLSILIVGVFELLPIINSANIEDQMVIFNVLRDIAIFSFLLNLLREIVKDIEDIQGDHVARYKTLPILLGARRSARITSVIGFVVLTIISWYTFTYLYEQKMAVAVVFFGIVAPLGYVCAQLWESDKKSEFTRLSRILKLVMIIGICTIPLISYTIEHAS